MCRARSLDFAVKKFAADGLARIYTMRKING
jgi:hypothetical protein